MPISETTSVAREMGRTDWPELGPAPPLERVDEKGAWRGSGNIGSAQPKLHQLRVGQGDLQRKARVLLLEKGEGMLGRPEQQMGDAIPL